MNVESNVVEPPKPRWHQTHLWQSLAALVAVAAGFVGLVHYLAPNVLPGDMPPLAASVSASAGPGSSSATSPAAPPLTAQVLSVGTCLNVRQALTDCTKPHAAEIIASPRQSCDSGALASYLGGISGVEVLITDPQRPTTGVAAQYCVVTLPVGVSNALPAQGSLGRSAVDAWRRCTDNNTAQDRLSCSTPHTGEVSTSG